MTDTTPPPAPEPTPYEKPATPATPYATPGAPAKTPVLSIIALITGILGLLGAITGGWGLLFSIAGVILGHLGQKRETAAKGLWLTGLITGYVGIAINVVVLAFVIIGLIALASVGSSYGY